VGGESGMMGERGGGGEGGRSGGGEERGGGTTICGYKASTCFFPVVAVFPPIFKPQQTDPWLKP
jgi:hypothetical protein